MRDWGSPIRTDRPTRTPAEALAAADADAAGLALGDADVPADPLGEADGLTVGTGVGVGTGAGRPIGRVRMTKKPFVEGVTVESARS